MTKRTIRVERRLQADSTGREEPANAEPKTNNSNLGPFDYVTIGVLIALVGFFLLMILVKISMG